MDEPEDRIPVRLSGDIGRGMELVEAGIEALSGNGDVALAVELALATVGNPNVEPDSVEYWRISGLQVALDLLAFAATTVEYMAGEFNVPVDVLLPLIRQSADRVQAKQDDSGPDARTAPE